MQGQYFLVAFGSCLGAVILITPVDFLNYLAFRTYLMKVMDTKLDMYICISTSNNNIGQVHRLHLSALYKDLSQIS